MSGLRHNPISGRWVAVAPRREGRPMDFAVEAGPRNEPFVSSCPFCPGNEHQLPAILFESDPTAADADWGIRAVPNLYPAFSMAEGDPDSKRTPTGFQEVLIESPFHDRDPSWMSDSELVGLLQAYQERLRSAARVLPNGQAYLFRNHGRDAGASLAHPHSQLIVVAGESLALDGREAALHAYFEKTGRSLVQDTMDEWGREGTVTESGDIRAVVPWAAEAPHEVWIAGKAEGQSFVYLGIEALGDLAGCLGSVLRAYREHCGDPSYNLMLQIPRFGSNEGAWRQWHLVLRPRTSRLAGFELSSGVYINTSSPEADAEYLRSVIRVPAKIGE